MAPGFCFFEQPETRIRVVRMTGTKSPGCDDFCISMRYLLMLVRPDGIDNTIALLFNECKSSLPQSACIPQVNTVAGSVYPVIIARFRVEAVIPAPGFRMSENFLHGIRYERDFTVAHGRMRGYAHPARLAAEGAVGYLLRDRPGFVHADVQQDMPVRPCAGATAPG